jgi:hypothetical protein
MSNFSLIYTICESVKKMLKMKIDFGMKFFPVALKGELGNITSNSEHPPVSQLVPFRPMSTSDIHASVEKG